MTFFESMLYFHHKRWRDDMACKNSIYVWKQDSVNGFYGKESLDNMMNSLDKTNSLLVGQEVREYYTIYNFILYRGLVVKKVNRYNSSMDMYHYDAIVADTDDEGNRVWKTVGCTEDDTVDAPIELQKEYDAYLKYKERRSRILKRWDTRKNFMRDRVTLGLKDRFAARNLYNYVGNENYYRMIDIVYSYKANRLRSNFRKSLAEQIVKWAKEENPKYKSPLSFKQMQYLAPYNPFKR